MKFVELKDDVGKPILVDLDWVYLLTTCRDGKVIVHFVDDNGSVTLAMTVAEVKAAIRDQAGPGGLAGTCAAEAPGAVRWDGDTVTLTFTADPDPCSGPCPGPPPSPEPEAGGPIPLAVGQVWGYKSGWSKAEITAVDGDRITRKIVSGPGAGDVQTVAELVFRYWWATLISPAPEPPSPEAPPDPVSLLAGGKRLRYVRDAGAISERIPAEVNAVLLSPAEDFHAVAFYSPGDFDYRAEDSGNYFLGDWNKAKQTGAISGLTFIKSLGYRFAGLAGEGA